VTNGLLSGKDNERRRQRRFQLSSATILHIRSSNVRHASKHFPTNEVDFLTNNVVLCTRTASRNATNDFRTESERLAYG